MRRRPRPVRGPRQPRARRLPATRPDTRKKSWGGSVGALIADLGLSSFQLEDPQRGFSFTADGPLDMRFDVASGRTAAGILADASEDELVAILRGADEPHARRIAREIVDSRRRNPVTTTQEFATLVERARPRDLRRRASIHPATLSFQALRMAVNDELGGLGDFVRDAVLALAPGGRLAIISFHAGEDRIVKNALADLAGRCTCPADALRCSCGRRARVQILTRKPIRPGMAEIASNPRSRSARLRAAERLAAPAS